MLRAAVRSINNTPRDIRVGQFSPFFRDEKKGLINLTATTARGIRTYYRLIIVYYIVPTSVRVYRVYIFLHFFFFFLYFKYFGFFPSNTVDLYIAHQSFLARLFIDGNPRRIPRERFRSNNCTRHIIIFWVHTTDRRFPIESGV
jgi:hypothetical protein